MSFWCDEGIKNVWLNDRITKIFRHWEPENFYNANEDGAVIVLDKIVDLVEKLNLDLTEIALVTKGFNSFNGHEKTISFSVDGLSDADIHWVVAHEIGHAVDWLTGRLVWVANGIEFEGQFVSTEFLNVFTLRMLFLNSDERKNLLLDYHRQPHEFSANNFAKIHAAAIPESDDFIPAYEVVR